MKKKMLSAFLCAAMAVTLVAGCGAPAADAGKDKGGDSKKEASEGIPKDEIKVGFVHISDPSDMGYTYNHDLGTKEMQKELGLSDDQIINKYNVPEDAECDTALRELVEAGCNIIFATSFGFEDYVKEVAAEYPDIQDSRHRIQDWITSIIILRLFMRDVIWQVLRQDLRQKQINSAT